MYVYTVLCRNVEHNITQVHEEKETTLSLLQTEKKASIMAAQARSTTKS